MINDRWAVNIGVDAGYRTWTHGVSTIGYAAAAFFQQPSSLQKQAKQAVVCGVTPNRNAENLQGLSDRKGMLHPTSHSMTATNWTNIAVKAPASL